MLLIDSVETTPQKSPAKLCEMDHRSSSRHFAETDGLLSTAGDGSSSKKSCFVSDGSALAAGDDVSQEIMAHILLVYTNQKDNNIGYVATYLFDYTISCVSIT